MSQSYQPTVTNGAEPNQPLQIPQKHAEGGISETPQQRPDVAGDTGKSDPLPQPPATLQTSAVAPQAASATPQTPQSSSPQSANNNQAATNGSHDQPSESAAPHVDYPEQKHAGAAGYGPHYAETQGHEVHVTMGDRFTGIKDEIKGKLTKNEGLVQEGRDIRTGEVKRRAFEKENNPHAKVDPKDSEKDQKPKEGAVAAKEAKGDHNRPEANQGAHHDIGDEKAGNETVVNKNPAMVQGEPGRRAEQTA